MRGCRMTWHLLLDYDRPEAVPGWPCGPLAVPLSRACADILAARLSRAGYAVTAFSFEPSTNGWHGKVELSPAPKSPMEIVALQAVCGSDPLRESCNVQRAREVMGLVEYAATVLDDALDNLSPPRDIPAVAVVRKFLAGCMAGPGAFWLDRWNVLYAPNPQRKRKVAE